MELDVSEQEANDPASKAFAKLRREVAMMRLAMEKLADEPAKIEIPDYAETLDDMAAQIKETSDGLAFLAKQPALAISPQNLAKSIAAAGVDARKAEQDVFDQAKTTFVTLGSEMGTMVASARSAKEQTLWLRCGIAGGAVIGALFMAILPGPIARAVPESWLWPEQRAIQALGMDGWQAGQRLLRVSNPDQWRIWATTIEATSESRDELAACLANSQRSGRPVRCSIRVEAAKLDKAVASE